MSEWQAVVFKAAGFSALSSALTRRGTAPVPECGTRCMCCDAETKAGIVYDTRDPRYQSSGIKIPRCDDCAPHIESGNTSAFGMLALGGGGILLIAIGATNGWPIAVVGVVCLAVLGAWQLVRVRHREAMAAKGHHLGFEITAIPNLVSIRTTNPRFANELRERNGHLLGR